MRQGGGEGSWQERRLRRRRQRREGAGHVEHAQGIADIDPCALGRAWGACAKQISATAPDDLPSALIDPDSLEPLAEDVNPMPRCDSWVEQLRRHTGRHETRQATPRRTPVRHEGRHARDTEQAARQSLYEVTKSVWRCSAMVTEASWAGDCQVSAQPVGTKWPNRWGGRPWARQRRRQSAKERAPQVARHGARKQRSTRMLEIASVRE